MEKYYIHPDGKYWGSVVDGDHLPFEGAIEVAYPPDTNAAQVWNGTAWGQYIPVLNPLDQLEALITQGQHAMAEAPLPDEILKQIYDLEVFVRNYFARGAFNLIRDTITAFVIPDGYPGVTTGQRAQVEGLKALMLAVFNGL